jgi:predicted secreted protein
MNDDVTPVAPPVSGGARRVAFVAHCLVNQNAKVQEFARSPGVVPGVVERMRRHGYRIQQLPCPEMAFAGVNRWWQGRELYDKANFRRHCRTLADNMAAPIAEFYRRGYEVVVVGLDGSPSSGVRYTGMARSWGGRPHFEDGDYEVVEGMGVWMEELRKGLEERGIPWPRASGMLLDTTDWDEARDLPRCLDELDEFLSGGGLTAEVPDAQS